MLYIFAICSALGLIGSIMLDRPILTAINSITLVVNLAMLVQSW